MESNTPILVTLTGPSCAGKSHLERLLKRRGFASVTSVTTRKPRAGEVDGQSYFFLDADEFAALDHAGELVEQVEYNGNRYGVTRGEMERVFETGKPIVVVVEPHGAHQYREYAEKMGWRILSLFVSNPPEVIARRFLERFAKEVDGECGADLDSYSSRLAKMMTEERGWVSDRTSHYDVWFDHFDGDSTEPIVGFIVNHVHELRGEPIEVQEAA